MEPRNWCQDANESPIVAVGALSQQQIPSELYGVVSALLLRGGEMGQDIQDQLRYLGFDLPDGPFRVVQYRVDDPILQEVSGRFRHNCRLNMYAAMREHLTQLLRDIPGGIFVLLMGSLFGILYTGDQEEQVIASCLDEVRYDKENFGFSAHVTISDRWEQVEQIETAYMTIQDVEKSRVFYGDKISRAFVIPKNALLRIADTKQRMQFEQTFFQSSERICGSVRAGDVEAARLHIRGQLEKIADNSIGMPYPTTLDLTTNRFISLLQYQLAEQDLADWRYISQIDFSRELVSQTNLEGYLDQSMSIAQRLVEHAKLRSEQRHDRLMRDIRAYVEENATDMNMGLTAVAREFKLKPREAAENFRQYFGESVNDVLHRARVKKARELLLTTDDSVQDIAEAVGYCSLATMYRAFTNVEGVAPGKIRQKKG